MLQFEKDFFKSWGSSSHNFSFKFFETTPRPSQRSNERHLYSQVAAYFLSVAVMKPPGEETDDRCLCVVRDVAKRAWNIACDAWNASHLNYSWTLIERTPT